MAKSLAAKYWRLHKRPAGRDCYGAPDPAFAKQPTKRAEDQGGSGGSLDPWARSTADRYQEEMQKAHRNIQRLERMVSDLRLKLGAYEHEEAAARILQRGGWARTHSDGEAGTQRGDAGQHLPAHAQNGGGSQASEEEQRYGGLSTMS